MHSEAFWLRIESLLDDSGRGASNFPPKSHKISSHLLSSQYLLRACYLSAVMLFLFLVLVAASAATVQYNFNITWVTANPDGLHPRPVIGINGQWPPPVLNVTRGDRIIANVYNGLGNQTTSLHWHGIFQNGTTHMDGAPAVTQCGIAPGGSFTYNFTVGGPLPLRHL
jgi:FtsP/CotA-like multicopper oxidase with cupredoxin domain